MFVLEDYGVNHVQSQTKNKSYWLYADILYWPNVILPSVNINRNIKHDNHDLIRKQRVCLVIKICVINWMCLHYLPPVMQDYAKWLIPIIITSVCKCVAIVCLDSRSSSWWKSSVAAMELMLGKKRANSMMLLVMISNFFFKVSGIKHTPKSRRVP